MCTRKFSGVVYPQSYRPCEYIQDDTTTAVSKAYLGPQLRIKDDISELRSLLQRLTLRLLALYANLDLSMRLELGIAQLRYAVMRDRRIAALEMHPCLPQCILVVGRPGIAPEVDSVHELRGSQLFDATAVAYDGPAGGGSVLDDHARWSFWAVVAEYVSDKDVGQTLRDERCILGIPVGKSGHQI
jgi:hypothetical protein